MANSQSVYILGGGQTDFARNWTKEGKHISADDPRGGRTARSERPAIEPREIRGRRTSATSPPSSTPCRATSARSSSTSIRRSAGLPTGAPRSRLRLGLDCAPRGVGRDRGRPLRLRARRRRRADEDRRVRRLGGDFLGTAAWYEREAKGVEFPFPKLFGRLGDEYDKRYGLKDEHLARISADQLRQRAAEPARADAHLVHERRRTPRRRRSTTQPIGGRIKVARLLAGDRRIAVACSWPRRSSPTEVREAARSEARGIPAHPRLGPSHRAARRSTTRSPRAASDRTCCRTRAQAILDAFRRAGLAGVAGGLDGIETHDCFTTSEYMAIDHFGLTKPGESWKAIEEGAIEIGGKLPINPSGGLIGAGHPVGAHRRAPAARSLSCR